jgi:hypothetical protein
MSDLVKAPDVMTLGTVSRRDKEGLRGRGLVVWAACPGCLFARWVPLRGPKRQCRTCAGREQQTRIRHVPRRPKDQRREKNTSWKGGIRTHASGYLYVLLDPDDWRRPMAGRDGYVFEHRAVMAEKTGRLLNEWESVHHINGNRTDNRAANLELWTRVQPSGMRQKDYHCAGCQCEVAQ